MLHFSFGKSFYRIFGHGHMLCKVSYCSWLWRQILYRSNIALISEGKQHSAFGFQWILLPKHLMSLQTLSIFDRICMFYNKIRLRELETFTVTAFWGTKLYWRWWKSLSVRSPDNHRAQTVQFFHNMTSPSFSARLRVWLYSKSIIIHVTVSSMV